MSTSAQNQSIENVSIPDVLNAGIRRTVVAHVFGERTLATLERLLSLLSAFEGSAWKTESMVTPVFATPILTINWLA